MPGFNTPPLVIFLMRNYVSHVSIPKMPYNYFYDFAKKGGNKKKYF
jgi:hypothetical protein